MITRAGLSDRGDWLNPMFTNAPATAVDAYTVDPLLAIVGGIIAASLACFAHYWTLTSRQMAWLDSERLDRTSRARLETLDRSFERAQRCRYILARPLMVAGVLLLVIGLPYTLLSQQPAVATFSCVFLGLGGCVTGLQFQWWLGEGLNVFATRLGKIPTDWYAKAARKRSATN